MNIFTEISAFFAAPFLAEALNAKLYVINTTYNDFFESNTNIEGIYCGDKTENINNDDITIIGTTSLIKLSKRIENSDFKRINLILCDSKAIEKYKWWNGFVKENNINLYLMPDIIPYCSVNYKPIYQFIKINEKLRTSKNDKLLITHSPRSAAKGKLKGSDAIIKIVKKLQKKYDFDFKILTKLSMDNVIREKSKSHIFIDQLIYGNMEIKQKIVGGNITYNGGLGKSGIEGMMLNCCVLTGGLSPDTQPFFKPPPITWTSHDKFYEDLELLVVDENKREQQIVKQNHWVGDVVGNKGFYGKYLKS